jgi:hypothetical protein
MSERITEAELARMADAPLDEDHAELISEVRRLREVIAATQKVWAYGSTAPWDMHEFHSWRCVICAADWTGHDEPKHDPLCWWPSVSAEARLIREEEPCG